MPAVRAFLAATGGLREAMLLVTAEGDIVAANAAARALAPSGQEERLGLLLAEGGDTLLEYLRRCSASGRPLPGALTLRGEAGPRRFRAEGWRYQPEPAGSPLVLLSLRAGDGAAQSFLLLNRQIEALNIENAARQRAVEALGDALAARDALLRELQHRVRNTIQLLTALLQAGGSEAGVTPAGWHRLIEQFHAVGLVQRQMTDANDLRRIALRPLLEELAALLEPPAPAGGFRVSGPDARLGVERATPLAILLARCMAGTGQEGSGGRVVALAASPDALTIRIDQPGPREACEAMLAEELSALLAEQIDASLSCERPEEIWQAVITLPPG